MFSPCIQMSAVCSHLAYWCLQHVLTWLTDCSKSVFTKNTMVIYNIFSPCTHVVWSMSSFSTQIVHNVFLPCIQTVSHPSADSRTLPCLPTSEKDDHDWPRQLHAPSLSFQSAKQAMRSSLKICAVWICTQINVGIFTIIIFSLIFIPEYTGLYWIQLCHNPKIKPIRLKVLIVPIIMIVSDLLIYWLDWCISQDLWISACLWRIHTSVFLTDQWS